MTRKNTPCFRQDTRTDERAKSFRWDINAPAELSEDVFNSVISCNPVFNRPNSIRISVKVGDRFGRGETNEIGIRLLELARSHQLILHNTLNPHAKI
ncbi:hypothetical protein DPMN_018184 [Dreissena polymorpha]|uniref:Uncharacterized protein n=1 Tax=Dreissena polymorpha TaxID=45954 RepID=A0A9D4NIX2_DREPO|nr:hypothetical protein DPMN_018184 [Dreissena polymorpha]